MFGFSQVSEPKIISGFIASTRLQNTSFLLKRLWKLIVRVRKLGAVLLLVGCFDGEDCTAGEPGSKELQLDLLVLLTSLSDKLALLSKTVESNYALEITTNIRCAVL